MVSPLELPRSITGEAESYFKKNLITDAMKLLQLSKVSLSFTKGTIDTYFIVSGLVREDRAHECKMVYKSRFIGTETSPVTSNCDCHQWTEENHCRHTIALFLLFHFNNTTEDGNSPIMDSGPSIPLASGLGVSILEYGTIISGPHQLLGAPPAPTYSSLQYVLHNKKVINFPLPENFSGKLQVHITSPEQFRTSEEGFETFPSLKFSWKGEDGEEVKEITLFENLYFFNWKNGEAFHLNSELKEFIQRIRIYQRSLDINAILKLCLNERLERYLEIVIDGKNFNEMEKVSPHCMVSLEPSGRKGQIQFRINFHDEQESTCVAPDFFSDFAFEGGILGSFRRKKDAYEFAKSLSEYFLGAPDNYKKILSSSTKKSEWINHIQFIEDSNFSFCYDAKKKQLCQYDNVFLKKFYVQMIECFGDMIFRYSEYNHESRTLMLQISSSNLFNGLSNFHQELFPFGVQVFYDRNEISRWSSRIRFERRSSSTKWFDLELNISDIDLSIIKKADLDQGLALTKNGLVLIDRDQKELLKFMKKYTKYEAQEKVDQNGNPVEEDPKNPLEEDEHKFILPFNKARIFELFELKKLGIEGALTPEEETLCEKLANLEEVPKYPMPEQLEEVMREYQKTGYHWLRFLYENKLGACLADDMGLGKTLQAIAFIASMYKEMERVLIVCPVSILLNWEKEFEKFSDIKPHIYHGGERYLPDDAKVILTSYGVMKREAEEVFGDKHFDVLILDEVQHLKNIRSLGAYAARKLNADFRICLTGTPVENDLAEFYNILDLSIPGIWGDLQFIRTSSTSKSRLLARKTASPFILRRTKAQVLTDLPPKIENNVYLELTENEWGNYKNNLESIKNKIRSAPSKKKYGEILKGLLTLRQSCLWQLEKPGQTSRIDNVLSTKIQFLIETLEQILEEGHQAIVFSQFTTYLDIIQQFVREKHWKLSRIDGSQSVKKRQQQVDIFQEGKSEVFLISLKAGGVGLNLTAASYVFIMDPWWNPAVEAQAIDRAHRIGQENTLTVYRPIIKGSVEEKVLELQEMKKQLFYDLLPSDDDSLFTGKLSMMDFEHLIT
ncbi:MAG: DEAD/DEAH box helicase [Bacteriovoracaceae bacterium]|nr:DEAD/DEAH box helicase [Bacteriovoracaceae bacterium]